MKPKPQAPRARPDKAQWRLFLRAMALADGYRLQADMAADDARAGARSRAAQQAANEIIKQSVRLSDIAGAGPAAGFLALLADVVASEAPKPRGPKLGESRMTGGMSEVRLLKLFDQMRACPPIASDRAAIIEVADIYITAGALAEVGRDAFVRRLQKLVKKRADARKVGKIVLG